MLQTISGNEWIQTVEEFHLPRWEELPDFEIYMDQLVTLVSQYVAPFQENHVSMITPSMINNYVKAKIMPKPIKKKYNKIHIAYALAITILKEVLTISEIRDGIEIQSDRCGLKGAYNLFCDELEASIQFILNAIQTESFPSMEVTFHKDNMAMKLCTASLISKIVARKMVAFCINKKYESKEN